MGQSHFHKNFENVRLKVAANNKISSLIKYQNVIKFSKLTMNSSCFTMSSDFYNIVGTVF